MTSGEAQGESLLRTKFHIPNPRNDLITRQRLTDRLQSNWLHEGRFNRRLTLVSAPAGYGKTTLIVQWLAQADCPVAWLTLEPAENDTTRFLLYILAALQTVNVEIGARVKAMLQAPQHPPHEVILTRLVNEIAAYRGVMVLVLDDYHVIQDVANHQILNFLVEHLPDNIHLVITSREDPPLPLHRLLARRQLLNVRQEDLSFQVEEVIDFFSAHSEFKLSRKEAELLTRRTEGWITGLQLAALSLRAAPDRGEFIQSFTGSNRYILDYLFEEVFEIQPQQVKDFLLKTSILDRICAELANNLTGQDDSQSILEKLEQSNFFIVPLDMARRWYRYHRLFGDLLMHRLQLSSEDIRHLHDTASQWYAQHGYLDEAIEHALSGEHWLQAGALIESASQEHLQKGELRTLLRWYQRVPEEVLLSRPDWALSYAWPMILMGEVQEADRVLERIKRMEIPDGSVLHGHIAAAEAFLRRSTGDLERTVELSKAALKFLPEDEAGPREQLLVNVGLITWHQGQLDEAQEALDQALASARISDNPYLHHTALLFMARTMASRGDLGRAAGLLERAEEIGGRVPTAVLGYCDQAEILFLQDKLDPAWRYLNKAREVAQAVGNQEFICACSIQQALFNLSLQDSKAAVSALEPALSISRSDGFPPLTKARIASCRVQAALAQGNVPLARVLYAAIPVPHDAGTFTRFLDLNKARLLIAEGKLAQATEYLKEAIELAEDNGWGFGLHLLHLLLAVAEENQEAAIRELECALRYGEPQGLIRTFMVQQEALVPLLRETARRGILAEYCGRILSAIEQGTGRSSLIDERFEPLSNRELEVLRLVAAGRSNRQIAEQLVISLGTAKSHLHHIFGKLDVASRTEAVARARELELL